jgi:hypothetical protein
MVTAANGEDEPRGDIPETSSLQLVDDTTSTIPAAIILPATIIPPPTTATASATTSLDASSASTISSGSRHTSSQSASDDPNPTLQEQEGYKRPRKPYTRGVGPQTTVHGKHTVQDVPNHYSLIYGSALAELQQDAKSYHKLKQNATGIHLHVGIWQPG